VKRLMIVLIMGLAAQGSIWADPLSPFTVPPDQKPKHKRAAQADHATLSADSARAADSVAREAESPDLAAFYAYRRSVRESDSADSSTRLATSNRPNGRFAEW